MEVKRLFDLFPYQLEKYPQEDAIGGKYDGKWVKFSTQQIIDLSDQIAAGLLDLGLKPGDMIAIMSDNSVEWVLADQAIQKMGGIVIPIYSTCSEEYLEFVLNHSEAQLIFVQRQDHLDKVNNVKAQVSSLQHIYGFMDLPGTKAFEGLKKQPDQARLKEIQDKIQADDLVSIIYTSGTTGDPKGVMLSHTNIASNFLSSIERLPVDHRHTALSFLPLAHIYERMIGYMYYYQGISVYFAESMETIGDNLKEIKPHVFTAVPRLLEKVFDRILEKGAQASPIRKALFNWAVKLALKWEPDGKNGAWYGFQMKIADIVFKNIRAAVGGRVIAACSGSAALQPRLARFFNAAGIPLAEGYGLTETSPVISVNGFEPGQLKIGTVGTVITGGEVKIADDGEILYKGPNVMKGYYKRDDLTKEAIEPDGFFHTGDIGVLDKDGFLKITDRKKDLFKTSGGKYIAPQLMENKFKESPYIEQIVVIGEYRKMPAALIVPNFDRVSQWVKSRNLQVSEGDHKAICAHSDVLELFQKEVDKLNKDYAQYEKIKKFHLLAEEFSIEGGELTTTLKVRRKIIDKKYEQEIEAIYA